MVFADINNRPTQLLQADILEQLSYQAKSATWRNAYLMASVELRKGNVSEDVHGIPDNAGNYAIPHLLDVMAVRPVPEKAAGKRFKANFDITDLKEHYVLSLSNSVLVYKSGVTDKDVDCSLVMERSTLGLLLSGQQSAEALIEAGKLKSAGDANFLSYIGKIFEKPSGMFNIVMP